MIEIRSAAECDLFFDTHLADFKGRVVRTMETGRDGVQILVGNTTAYRNISYTLRTDSLRPQAPAKATPDGAEVEYRIRTKYATDVNKRRHFTAEGEAEAPELFLDAARGELAEMAREF